MCRMKGRMKSISLRKMKCWLIAAAFALNASMAFSADEVHDQRLVVNFMLSSGPQRTEWNNLLKAFKAAHPEIDVQQYSAPQEPYKKRFYDSVKKPVDVALWFAGAQLTKAHDLKLLRPLDVHAAALVSRSFTPATLKAVRYGGQYYAVPLSYYQWGFFYKKSTFAKLGLTVPSNWQEFQAVAEALKAANITPTQVGAKTGWPAMAWFDYLNLRINGLDFHRELLSGAVPFTDPRVVKVFDVWKELLVRGYFDGRSTTLEWDEVLPYLYRDVVGMTLMGAFAATKFPRSIAKDIGFFPFPQMATPPTRFEDAPLDVLVFPASGENPGATDKFVRFLAENDALNQFNEATQLISPRLGAPPGKSASLMEGKKLLDHAAGISFFFDRDAAPRLVEAANKAFAEFMTPPHDIAKAIMALETARH